MLVAKFGVQHEWSVCLHFHVSYYMAFPSLYIQSLRIRITKLMWIAINHETIDTGTPSVDAGIWILRPSAQDHSSYKLHASCAHTYCPSPAGLGVKMDEMYHWLNIFYNHTSKIFSCSMYLESLLDHGYLVFFNVPLQYSWNRMLCTILPPSYLHIMISKYSSIWSIWSC